MRGVACLPEVPGTAFRGALVEVRPILVRLPAATNPTARVRAAGALVLAADVGQELDGLRVHHAFDVLTLGHHHLAPRGVMHDVTTTPPDPPPTYPMTLPVSTPWPPTQPSFQ